MTQTGSSRSPILKIIGSSLRSQTVFEIAIWVLSHQPMQQEQKIVLIWTQSKNTRPKCDTHGGVFVCICSREGDDISFEWNFLI